MLSENAIEITNLSKCYRIYDKAHHRLLQMIDKRPKKYYREFWALNNVSFEIKKGETVGVLGRNGSGKSTLLQLICGTLSQTSGSIEANGRIAALLELGSGFNPEFTGRENVFLNANILGLSNDELGSVFHAIVDFADIGDFLDQPVKMYSSGMVVRLAFSVAIHSNPSILVIDEALSVGDELFQRKCFAKIQELKKSGATILFVSHAIGSILELCDRAALIDGGFFIGIGPPKKIVEGYQKLLYSSSDQKEATIKEIEDGLLNPEFLPSPDSYSLKNLEHRSYFDQSLISKSVLTYESRGAIISQPRLKNLSGEEINTLTTRYESIYSYDVVFDRDCQNVRFGMLIKTKTGFELGGAASHPSRYKSIPYIKAGQRLTINFNIRSLSLSEGAYFLNAGVMGEVDGTMTFLHRVIDALAIKILPYEGSIVTGIVDFDIEPNLLYWDGNKPS